MYAEGDALMQEKVYVIQMTSRSGVTAIGISTDKETAITRCKNRYYEVAGLNEAASMNTTYWLKDNVHISCDIPPEDTIITRIRKPKYDKDLKSIMLDSVDSAKDCLKDYQESKDGDSAYLAEAHSILKTLRKMIDWRI